MKLISKKGLLVRGYILLRQQFHIAKVGRKLDMAEKHRTDLLGGSSIWEVCRVTDGRNNWEFISYISKGKGLFSRLNGSPMGESLV